MVRWWSLARRSLGLAVSIAPERDRALRSREQDRFGFADMLTPRCSQRRLPLPPSLGSYGGTGEFVDGLSYTTVMEIAEPLARRRGPALDRSAK